MGEQNFKLKIFYPIETVDKMFENFGLNKQHNLQESQLDEITENYLNFYDGIYEVQMGNFSCECSNIFGTDLPGDKFIEWWNKNVYDKIYENAEESMTKEQIKLMESDLECKVKLEDFVLQTNIGIIKVYDIETWIE